MDDNDVPFTIDEHLAALKAEMPGVLEVDPIKWALDQLPANELTIKAKKFKALQPIKLEDGYTIEIVSKNKNKVTYLFKDDKGEETAEYEAPKPLSISKRTTVGKEIIEHGNEDLNAIKQLLNQQLKEFHGPQKSQEKITLGEPRELTGVEIEEVVRQLRPYYIDEYRNNICFGMDGWMRKQGISKTSALAVIEELSVKDGTERAERIGNLIRTYETTEIPIEKLAGSSWIKDVLELQGIDDKEQHMVLKTLHEIIDAPEITGDVLQARTGTYEAVESDGMRIWHVHEEYNGTDKYGEPNITYNRNMIVSACPRFVKVYQSPLAGESREFEVEWVSPVLRGVIKREAEAIDDLGGFLKANALTGSRFHLGDLSAYLNQWIVEDLAEISYEIRQPGFFCQDKRIIAVKYELEDITSTNLEDMRRTIIELGNAYPLQREKLATVIKWGLIAPFNYAIKQVDENNFLVDLLLYGWGGSGKSTMGKIALAVYSPKTTTNISYEKSGDSVKGGPRMGKIRSKSTFPVLIEEAQAILSDKHNLDGLEVMKAAIVGKVSRGKYGRLSGAYRDIPAIGTMVLTCNDAPPELSALRRRLESIAFDMPEGKTDEIDTAAFKQKFFRDDAECFVGNLRYLGQQAYFIIAEDPDLLRKPWKELADYLIERIYREAGFKIPIWLREWADSETILDLEELKRERIKNAIRIEINDKYTKRTLSQEEPIREEKTTVKEANDFRDKVYTVLNYGLIPWMTLKNIKGDNYVFMTSGIVDFLKANADLSDTLNTIGYILTGDKADTHRISDRKTAKSIKIELGKFVQFLYDIETGE